MDTGFYTNFEDMPALLLWSVFKLWQRCRRDALKELGVTHAEFILIAWLSWFAKQNIQITQVMLAERSKMDIMHTSRIVRTLEKKGLLTRKESPEDSRANYLSITSKGEQLAPKAIADIQAAHKTFFKPIEGKEKEFTALMKTLMKANDIPVRGGDRL